MSLQRNLRNNYRVPHLDITRFLHATPTLQFPVNRRKRSATRPANNPDGEGDSSMTTQKLHRVSDPDEFATKTNAFIGKLMKALRPLEKINDPFLLTLSLDEEMGQSILLDLGPVNGQYTIQFDMDEQSLYYVSPISGKISYYLMDNGEWCSRSDGHNFEGILVRDLIRQIQGVPDL
jgi:frataxin-like iron-binding protein CyaY